jgi:hypothetical protein
MRQMMNPMPLLRPLFLLPGLLLQQKFHHLPRLRNLVCQHNRQL